MVAKYVPERASDSGNEVVRREALMNPKHARFPFLTSFAILLLATACQEPCSGRLVDISKPIRVRELSVKNSVGQIVWRFESSGTQLSRVTYGRLPDTSVQMVPKAGLQPHPLKPGEELTVRIYSDDSFYFVHGRAVGPQAFCGSTYEAGPLKQLSSHNRSLKRMAK